MCNASGLYNSIIGNGNIEEALLGINCCEYGSIIFNMAGFCFVSLISSKKVVNSSDERGGVTFLRGCTVLRVPSSIHRLFLGHVN